MQSASPGRAIVRTIVVTIISSWAVFSCLADAALPWHPYSTFGFAVDQTESIIRVTPPASAAGLALGDKVDLRSTTLENRRYATFVFPPFTFEPGAVTSLAVDRDHQLKRITLTSNVRARSLADNVSDELLVVAQVAFIVVATALVLVRPSRMTWAFYIYGIAINAGADTLYQTALPFDLLVINFGLVASLSVAGTAGFVEFALRFPTDVLTGVRAWIDRLIPIITIPLMALAAYSAVAPILWAIPTPGVTASVAAITIAGYVAGVTAFIATYLSVSGDARQRIRWVIVGFAVGFGGYLVFTLLTLSPYASIVTPWLSNALNSLNIVVPIVVAYAVVKHRVIDVRFVVSRALVYGILTAIVIALLGLVDWLIGKAAAQTQLALVASLALAVGTGFLLNGLQQSIDRAIDGILFKRRHLAERRLNRIAASLPHAASDKTIDTMLVDESVDALRLASSALFRSDGKGKFVRAASIGWNDGATELDADDPAILQLQGDHSPLRIEEIRRIRSVLPRDDAHPVVAIPIVVRHSIEALVFYGAHTSGEDIDPSELRILCALALSSGAAFDHIEAQTLRRRVEALERENASLHSRGSERI
jgi:hypothetical protein